MVDVHVVVACGVVIPARDAGSLEPDGELEVDDPCVRQHNAGNKAVGQIVTVCTMDGTGVCERGPVVGRVAHCDSLVHGPVDAADGSAATS